MGFVIGFGVGLSLGVVVMALASISAQRREWDNGYMLGLETARKEYLLGNKKYVL